MPLINEDLLEQNCMQYFKQIGYDTLFGPDILPDSDNHLRKDIKEVFLPENLKSALIKLNPSVSQEVIEDAYRAITKPNETFLLANNRLINKYYKDGIKIEHKDKNGNDTATYVKVFDFENSDNNEFIAINQFSIQGQINNRRPDIIIFINGLPLVVIELKNPADENADIQKAFNQIQTYKTDIEDLFNYNIACIISDGVNARIGSLSADFQRFMPWYTIDGSKIKNKIPIEDEVLIKGFFNKEFLLDFINYFVVFEEKDNNLTQKIASYYQFHATRKAVNCALKAVKNKDGKIGVIWHTTGSGKSLSMVCFANKIMKHPEMKNPTIVVVTDRNDLDGQLFNTFACEAKHLSPVQAESREDLQELLKNKPSGGLIFTTIQKFMPLNGQSTVEKLSDRSNIIVISDEAHRSQYGFEAKLNEKGELKYGYAKYMHDGLPNACFIGFTGTPVEFEDRDTRAVFGDYIDIYDIQDSIRDKATVPIYYEARRIPIIAKDGSLVTIDEEIETALEGCSDKEKEKARWTKIEAMAGMPDRLKILANDIVNHYEKRCNSIEGKAFILCMSRQICVDLYNEITKIRPQWHDDDPKKGVIKVIMTGSASDTADFQKHLYNKVVKQEIEKRMRDSNNELKIAIVCDMWLTGFNVPSLHTMYIDKPMKGYNIIQAISRVNRVFKDKDAGLIVDYIGLVNNLEKAIKNYTSDGGTGTVTIDVERAFEEFLSAIAVCRDYLYKFDYSSFRKNALVLRVDAIEYILSRNKDREKAKKDFCDACLNASKAYGLCKNMKKAFEYNDELAFFQLLRATIIKQKATDGTTTPEKKDINQTIRDIVASAIVTNEVEDIFKSVGLDKPNIGIISEDFLSKIKNIKQKNLAVELLERLINGEIKSKFNFNLAQKNKFSIKLKEVINRYNNATLETAQIIEELIGIAKEINKSVNRGEELGLNSQELAFYNALEENESSVRELGDEVLKKIAQELTEYLRKSTKVDWAIRENVRASIMLQIKRILRKYKYPPDQQENAIKRVIEQAEIIADVLSA